MTREQWRRLAGDVLRKAGRDGERPEQVLATTTYDDITLAPLYDAADLTELPGPLPHAADGRVPGASWQIRQRHERSGADEVMADLENGVDSLWLAAAPEELPQLLHGVEVDMISVVLEAGDRTGEAVEALRAVAGDRAPLLRGCLGADPIGTALRSRLATAGQAGDAPPRTALDALPGSVFDPAAMAALARLCVEAMPGMRAVVVDATPYHETGGSDAEELGASLSTGLTYLRALTCHGLGVDEAFGQLEFRYAAGADQFATIAKLRAARVLWARVAEICGGPSGQFQHVVTSGAMMTRRDPWTNLLRTTLAGFAAGVAGADALTVRPFDDAIRPPDGFSLRIARNTSALLIEEAHVARVADPAAGSWYVERRTADLAEAAWQRFQEIEAAGGIPDGLSLVLERIAATRDRRARDIARRKLPIVGVSQFPDPAEAAPRSRTEGYRYAQEFEELGELAEAREIRPKVFLAVLGPPVEHAARLAFAQGVFGAGRIETVAGEPDDFAGSGASVACLCAGDGRYAQEAVDAAATLRRAGASRIWLAGRDRYDGVDGNLYLGCDVADVIRTTLLEVCA